jgi:hypothetical protein
MNKYMKWTIVAVLIFTVLFAIGCARSVLEGDETVAVLEKSAVSGTAMQVADNSYATGDYVSSEYASSEPSMYRNYPYYEEHYGSGDDVDVELMIIKNANMNIQVADFFLASQKIEAFASKYSGYVSNSNLNSDSNNRQSGTITIRVPEIYYDAVVAELNLLGNVESKRASGEDVTEQYIDLESRKNNLEQYERRLVSMYKEADTFDELKWIESELSRVRVEIERVKGRERYIDNKAEMSTITVYIYEKKAIVEQWGVWTAMKNALNHSISTLKWMIEVAGWLLPLMLAGWLAWSIVRCIRGREQMLRKRTG